MSVSVRRLNEDEKAEHLLGLAHLRIAIFADWPYIYDGDLAYEANYLKPYCDDPCATIIGAFDGNALIGAATAAPLASHALEFATPFTHAGLALSNYYYLAESILLPKYRGQGIGVAFFEEREKAAQEFGFLSTVFCSVERPENHPLRPQNYKPLDQFWQKRGYARLGDLKAHYAWKDIGQSEVTSKPLSIWHKRLTA